MTEDYVARTKEIFKDLIKRPKLSDKHLSRPPFRFIHDIVTNTLKSSGFPKGLFDENELNSKAIKDKDAKVAWLEKLIKCVESVTRQPVIAEPLKISAGKEPENTNLLLQAFGNIAIDVSNGQLSMEQILQNMNNPESESQIAAQQTEEPKAAEPAIESRRETETKAETNGESEDWITQTQQTLGALIQRPRLLDKLLRKPPFRFIHDIVKALIKANGFPSAFLDEDKDLNQANIKDAKFKYYFLSKLIVIVSATLNEDLSFIDPKHIIAGRKPEDTNCLLTALANASTSKIDIDRIKESIKQRQQSKKSSPKQDVKKAAEEDENVGKKTARRNAPIMPKLQLEQLQSSDKKQSKAVQPIKPKAVILSKDEKMSTAKTKKSEEQKPFAAIHKLQRPRTARRAPPKLKTNVIEEKQAEDMKNSLIIMDDLDEAQHEVEPNGNVQIVDHQLQQSEENELERLGFINKNNAQTMQLEEDNNGDAEDGNHGKLVRDILDAQSGIKLDTMRLGTHRKDSAKSTERIENMREMIQKICQTSLPLAKCIDLVFEDVESINNELAKWKQQIVKNKASLIEEQEKTDKILNPLHSELQHIKEEIERHNLLILKKKALLLKNQDKMSQNIRKRLLNE